jgi:hypothetical protein
MSSKTATALFDWPGETETDLPLRAGELICVTRHSSAWFSGYRLADPSHTGNFPGNYVEDVGRRGSAGRGGKGVLTPLAGLARPRFHTLQALLTPF